MNTTRRTFLSSVTAATAGSALFSLNLSSSASAAEQTVSNDDSLVDSAPSLQIPSATSIGVVWAVKSLAGGWVEVAEKQDFSDARRVYAGTDRVPLNNFDERILSVRVTNLAPATKYYYRTGTFPVAYPNAYKVTCGEPVVSESRTFTTMGDKAASGFAVINDTHANDKNFAVLAKKLADFNAPVTIWNGDLGEQSSPDYAVEHLLRPAGTDFAAQRPVLFVPGNHDYRGPWTRNLPKVLLCREPSEKTSDFWSLGRNFAVRQGDIAMIGLDTGEDKPDKHPVFQGLARFEPYRELQAKWLEAALQQPEIQSAPYLVAFCHIPLWDSRPDANPGDLLEGYASWQRPSGALWWPLFNKYGVQALICAHMHRTRCDDATNNRSWVQMVGGGPNPNEGVSIIEGKVENGELVIRTHDVYNDKVLYERRFGTRK